MNIKHEKTKQILALFEEISAIPRCSKHEEKIGAFLLDWAEKNGLQAKTGQGRQRADQGPGHPGLRKDPGPSSSRATWTWSAKKRPIPPTISPRTPSVSSLTATG